MRQKIIEQDLEEIYSRNIPWQKLENKTVLVTGAYGMLASYVMYMLLYLNICKGIHVTIIAVVRSLAKFQERFGDVTKYPFLNVVESDLTQKIDFDMDINYIIHAASLASPQYYSVCPIDVLLPNIIGNYYMLRLAEGKAVEGYLLFSTGDIYGVVNSVQKIKECDYGIMDTLDIHNCYSESKRMAETMCKAWFHQKGVPVKIVRIWHTYAPTMDIERDPRVFATFVSDIVNKRNIVMKSDGSAKRSFCYIADAIAAYFLVLFCGVSGEAYNVCNSKEFYSIRELAEIMVSLYPELNLKVERRERDKADVYVENSVANTIPPDNSKLKLLGWEEKYNVQTGFKRVIDSIGVI